ncbi:MAG TPA: hypothetical protein VFZ73_00660 [Gemmatimonadaceae bacterium]
MKDAPSEVFDRGSLAELLAARARQASDRRLVLDAAVGLLAATLIAIFKPPLWVPLSALAVALGSFGAWGIIDREASDTTGTRATVLRSARAAVMVLGALSAAVFGLTLFFALLGPIIS